MDCGATMTLCGRLVRRSSTNLKQQQSTFLALPRPRCRTFSSQRSIGSCTASVWTRKVPKCQKRAFASCLPRSNQSQVAPNAKAYLESGAIAGARNLIDVKKVLVIGSGGLSIGQAGEFDYSGV